MRLIAEGRASEILDLGDGRVLRRFKKGGNPQCEARVMEHARRHGYPVPELFEVRPDALVLELVEGPTMAASGLAQPETMDALARTLADLHDRLHGVPGLERDTLLHLDLHPENVLLSTRGPVVVDWTNAGAGEPAFDVALVWVILVGTGEPIAERFARDFVAHFDGWRAGLDDALAYRFADPNVTDEERARLEPMRNH